MSFKLQVATIGDRAAIFPSSILNALQLPTARLSTKSRRYKHSVCKEETFQKSEARCNTPGIFFNSVREDGTPVSRSWTRFLLFNDVCNNMIQSLEHERISADHCWNNTDREHVSQRQFLNFKPHVYSTVITTQTP